MPRPKLPKKQKKERLNLTVSPETKEMIDLMRIKMNVSISEFFETVIQKEFKKMSKKGEITDILGQMSIEDLE